VVIGAMRAGTTTLYELFRASGLVSVPRMKETDFFILEENYQRGQQWLAGQFDDLSKPCCDFSPNYAKRDTFPNCAMRIRETNPDAHLIFIARDPVKRAISQFNHMHAMGFDMPCSRDLPDHQEGVSIVQASEYARQIEAYLDYFPMEQIHVVDFDDLIHEQEHTLRRVLTDVGVCVEKMKLEEVNTNSSEQLNKMPAIWGKFRRTKAGDWVRSVMPRGYINRAKKIASAFGTQRAVEPFDPKTEAFLKSKLKGDAARFRQLTGQSFDNWTV